MKGEENAFQSGWKNGWKLTKEGLEAHAQAMVRICSVYPSTGDEPSKPMSGNLWAIPLERVWQEQWWHFPPLWVYVTFHGTEDFAHMITSSPGLRQIVPDHLGGPQVIPCKRESGGTVSEKEIGPREQRSEWCDPKSRKAGSGQKTHSYWTSWEKCQPVCQQPDFVPLIPVSDLRPPE